MGAQQMGSRLLCCRPLRGGNKEAVMFFMHDGEVVSLAEVIDDMIMLVNHLEFWGDAGEMEIIPLDVLF